MRIEAGHIDNSLSRIKDTGLITDSACRIILVFLRKPAKTTENIKA